MRMGRTSLAASVLSWALSATAIAQAPALTPAPAGDSTSAAYPSNDGGWLFNDTATPPWNLESRFRAQADWVFLNRDNTSRDVPLIAGPETTRFGDLNFNYQSGTRVTFGYLQDDYEFNLSFLTLGKWSDARSGILAHAVDFDGPTAFGAAVPAARMAVDGAAPNPNFIVPQSVFSPMNAAANTSGETNELEFLKQGAAFETRYTSDLRDIEANYQQRSQPGRRWRLGVGFRNVQFREDGFSALSGTFGTVDTNGGTSQPNNGLSDGAIKSAGLSLTSAATTNTGFSDVTTTGTTTTPADQLLFTSRAHTTNQLNGMQATVDLMLFESDYFDLSTFGKVGVYHNYAHGSVREQYADTLNDKSTYARSFTDHRQAASFVGHTGLTGRLYLRENIRIVSGYELYYLTGLALAPDQVAAVNGAVPAAATLNLRTHGTALLHGGRVGLEILFP